MMDEQKEMNHMRELVELLNRARRSYEQENTEIMSNYEYDKLYDELQVRGLPSAIPALQQCCPPFPPICSACPTPG